MEMYYGQHNNAFLYKMFSGYSENISMEEIYGADYNSSIYQFMVQTGDREAFTATTIGLTLQSLTGLDGSQPRPSGLLGLSLLSSSYELCATFFFLLDSGVKYYRLILALYAEQNRTVYMKGFMSLPNQTRSFDRFQLFQLYKLEDNKKTVMDFSVTSLKLLQKRNTVAEPCIHVDNYDKVHKKISCHFISTFVAEQMINYTASHLVELGSMGFLYLTFKIYFFTEHAFYIIGAVSQDF
jgi:hypothetical protein